jgi:transposase-like protein
MNHRKHNLVLGFEVGVYEIVEISNDNYKLKCTKCDSEYWRTRKQVVDAISRKPYACRSCRSTGKVKYKYKPDNDGKLTDLQTEWLRRAWC